MQFTIDRYIGIPYLDRGRGFDGCDCWGLVKLFYENEMDIPLPDFDVGREEWQKIDGIVRSEKVWWKSVVIPTTPCVVVLKLDRRHIDWCTHLGVHIGDGWMLHTSSEKDSVRIRIDHPFYRNRVEGFYEYTE